MKQLLETVKFPHLRAHRDALGLSRRALAAKTGVEYWKLDRLDRGLATHLNEKEVATLRREVPGVDDAPPPRRPPGETATIPTELEAEIMSLSPDQRTERMAGVVARTVASAIHASLANEELSKTKKGQIAIADALHYFAMSLSRELVDVSGIMAVEGLLRRGVL